MREELKNIQKRAKELVAPFTKLQRLGPVTGRTVAQLEALLAEWPVPEVLASGSKEIGDNLRQLVSTSKAAREQEFRKIEAEFIRTQREAGVPLREKDKSWRVGQLEIEVNRAVGSARALYNGEPLSPFVPVASAADLEKVRSEALRKLEAASVEDRFLSEAVVSAYEAAAHRLNAEAVSLTDLYREFRVALVRAELSSGRPDRPLRYGAMPRWAFTWNLDRYRELPGEKTLRFEPGSQSDTARGLAFILGGRTGENRNYCWVKRSRNHERSN